MPSGIGVLRSFRPDSAGASTAPVLGLGVDVPLGEPWTLTMQVRRKWLDSSVRNSPLLIVAAVPWISIGFLS